MLAPAHYSIIGLPWKTHVYSGVHWPILTTRRFLRNRGVYYDSVSWCELHA